MDEETTNGEAGAGGFIANAIGIVKDSIINHPVAVTTGFVVGLAGSFYCSHKLRKGLKKCENRLKEIETRGVPVTLHLSGELKKEESPNS